MGVVQAIGVFKIGPDKDLDLQTGNELPDR